MRPFFALALWISLASGVPVVPAADDEGAPPKIDKKQLEAEAHQFITEGKALEQQGKLAEAQDKYVDAEGVFSTRDALSGIKRIHDAEQEKLKSELAEAHRDYEAGKYSDCAQALERGLEIDRTNPAIHTDAALCEVKLGDRAAAVDDLAGSAGAARGTKERLELLEVRSALLLGMDPPDSASAEKSLDGFNEDYLGLDRDPGKVREGGGDQAPPGGDLCDTTRDLAASFPSNPAVIFNSAKCADEDSRQGEAARLLEQYAKLTPQALDRSDAEARAGSLGELAGLAGDAGTEVRRRYANADRYLDYRRYDRAITEYQAAEKALPGYAETEWRLGLLYEAYADLGKSREHLERFRQLETSQERKDDAGYHLDSLAARRTYYDAVVEESEDLLADLLIHSMGLDVEHTQHRAKLSRQQRRRGSRRYKRTMQASEKLSPPYVARQLDRARVNLEKATDLFPLGVEANELQALIALEGNDWPAAYRSFDAVASQGFPVSFYAQVNSGHDSRVVRAAKIEVGKESVRVVCLSSYNSKKQVSEAPASPAGDDDLGNLVVSPDQPPDPQAEAFSIAAADIRGIETDKNFVVLKLANDRLYLAPVYMLAFTPFEGRAARSFANEYTRLFVRYLGYEDAKLGKEGMTTGEKFRLGFEVANLGLAYFSVVNSFGLNTYNAVDASARFTQLAHALAVYREVVTTVRTVSAVRATAATVALAHSLAVDAGTLQRTAMDQQRALEGLQFKIIPSQPVQLKFRDKP